MKQSIYRVIQLICFSLFQIGCVTAATQPESVTIIQQTSGQSEKFTQYELDVAYRKQAREDSKAGDPTGALDICCVVFASDIEMLNIVKSHFKENSNENIDDYGLLVQENNKNYIVQLWERYRTSTQIQINGYWTPGIGENPVPQYAYVIDRDTLEIIEFRKVPY